VDPVEFVEAFKERLGLEASASYWGAAEPNRDGGFCFVVLLGLHPTESCVDLSEERVHKVIEQVQLSKKLSNPRIIARYMGCCSISAEFVMEDIDRICSHGDNGGPEFGDEKLKELPGKVRSSCDPIKVLLSLLSKLPA
jgi:hypothetical protein